MNFHMKARYTLYDLDNHPAIGGPVFTTLQLLDLDIVEMGKHGRIRPYKGKDTVYYTQQNYKKFKKEFDEEFKDYSAEELKTQKSLISIDAPYKTIYGKPWEFDHIEYWGELPFVVFRKANEKDWYNRTYWDTYQGVSAAGKTFEEMIVNLGRKYKRIFGNFNALDFLTDKEKRNHDKEQPRIDKPNGKIKGCISMVSNPKYIHVDPPVLNLRWAKWFLKTAYGKKNWPDEFQL